MQYIFQLPRTKIKNMRLGPNENHFLTYFGCNKKRYGRLLKRWTVRQATNHKQQQRQFERMNDFATVIVMQRKSQELPKCHEWQHWQYVQSKKRNISGLVQVSSFYFLEIYLSLHGIINCLVRSHLLDESLSLN